MGRLIVAFLSGDDMTAEEHFTLLFMLGVALVSILAAIFGIMTSCYD